MGALQQAPMVYRKSEYRKIIERMLMKYPVYKRVQQIDYPPMIASADEQVQGGLKEYKSPTEKYGIRRAERAKIIDQVEFALLFLSNDERQLIEKTYFDQPSKKTYYLLDLSERTYYRLKRQAFEKMAEALNMRSE